MVYSQSIPWQQDLGDPCFSAVPTTRGKAPRPLKMHSVCSYTHFHLQAFPRISCLLIFLHFQPESLAFNYVSPREELALTKHVARGVTHAHEETAGPHETALVRNALFPARWHSLMSLLMLSPLVWFHSLHWGQRNDGSSCIPLGNFISYFHSWRSLGLEEEGSCFKECRISQQLK